MSNIIAKNKGSAIALANPRYQGKSFISPSRIVSFLILFVLAAIAMYPFAWMLMTSLRDSHTVFTGPFIPTEFKIDAYITAWG